MAEIGNIEERGRDMNIKRLIKLLEFLETPRTLKEIIYISPVAISRNTAKTYISALVELNIVEGLADGKEMRYRRR